ncbi:MAG: hypothetical protein R3D86_09325 [Emcibacteraceae bacterium]
MNENNEISLPNYILRSLFAAWKVIQINPKAMDYFDLSSDGFWKSFWAIAVMLPVFILNLIYRTQGMGQPLFATELIFFFITLPLNAFVMYYFTRYMNINTNYPSMVIANNWVSAASFNILVLSTLIINLLAPQNIMSSVVLIIISFYFGIFAGWFMYRISLQISGALAVGVLLFDILFSQSVRIIVLKILDPEIYQGMLDTIHNLPS